MRRSVERIGAGLWGFLILLWMVGGAGCRSEVIGSSADAAGPDGTIVGDDGLVPPPDAEVPGPDTGVDPDPCGYPTGPSFSLDTTVVPTLHNGYIQQWDVSGEVGYHGPPTDPGSTWHGELQLLGADGVVSTLLYRLPVGYAIPVVAGDPLIMTFRRTTEVGVLADAVVISPLTAGVTWPLFIADDGGMLDVEDALVSPLRVERVDSTVCPQETNQCGTIAHDALLFDPSTGGIITQLRLEQGEEGQLDILGQPFAVINLGSGHYADHTMRCVDYLPMWVYYVAMLLE